MCSSTSSLRRLASVTILIHAVMFMQCSGQSGDDPVAVDCDDCRCQSTSSATLTLVAGSCTPNLNKVAVTGVQLKAIPAGAFGLNLTNITSMDLSNNKLQSLPAGLFDSLRLLEHLNLAANSLAMLPEGIFQHQTALKSLSLQENELINLPQGVFGSLKSLLSLKLQDNLLVVLPSGVFDHLTNLTVLDVRGNVLNHTADLCVFRAPRNLLTEATVNISLPSSAHAYLMTNLSAEFCTSPCSVLNYTGCTTGFLCEGMVYNYTCEAGRCEVKAPSNSVISPNQPSIVYNQTVSFSCESGYSLHGTSSATCNATFQLSQDAPSCRDIDECMGGTHSCAASLTCLNTLGSYKCCASGIAEDGNGCLSPVPDINSPGVSVHPCMPLALVSQLVALALASFLLNTQ